MIPFLDPWGAHMYSRRMNFGSPIFRRMVTIPAVTLAGVSLLGFSPLWILLVILVGIVRRKNFILFRLGVFGTVYCWAEILGLVAVFFILLEGVFAPHRMPARLHRLQNGWGYLLFSVAKRLLKLQFEVTGKESLRPSPFLLCLRHSSLLDTLIPAVFIGRPFHIQLRYILKKELLLDPCLDIVGNLLPNYFVDRKANAIAEAKNIQTLASGMTTGEAVLIYPEGTRFSLQKQTQILARMREKGHPLWEEAAELRHVLPPKTKGVEAMLQATPSVDVVFCTHTGFEMFTDIRTVFSGAVLGQRIRIHFRRTVRSEIPAKTSALPHWLFQEWKHIDRQIEEWVQGT